MQWKQFARVRLPSGANENQSPRVTSRRIDPPLTTVTTTVLLLYMRALKTIARRPPYLFYFYLFTFFIIARERRKRNITIYYFQVKFLGNRYLPRGSRKINSIILLLLSPRRSNSFFCTSNGFFFFPRRRNNSTFWWTEKNFISWLRIYLLLVIHDRDLICFSEQSFFDFYFRRNLIYVFSIGSINSRFLNSFVGRNFYLCSLMIEGN